MGREIGIRIVEYADAKMNENLATWTAEDVETFKRLFARFTRDTFIQLPQPAIGLFAVDGVGVRRASLAG